MNPPYRSYTQGNPSKVIFRHGAQFFAGVTRALRGCFRGGFVKVPITPKNVFRFVKSLYRIRKNAARIFG